MALCAPLLTPAQAAPVSFDFDVFVTSGPYSGTSGTGMVSFDDSDLDGDGNAVLEGDEFSLLVTLFGQSFTEADDYDAPFYPELVVSDGSPTGLDFLVTEVDPPFVTGGCWARITA